MKVKVFTEESLGKQLPDKPRAMTYDEVKFLIRMAISEYVELAQTVTTNANDAMLMVASAVNTDLKPHYIPPTNNVELIAHQSDAVVDANYYALNAFAKVGVNLSKIFDVVHGANMAKKFPDGTFHRREDGKVIKPPAWKEPDVNGEIMRQKENGAWA